MTKAAQPTAMTLRELLVASSPAHRNAELDGPAVHAFCHLRQDERSFWLGSIRHAVPAR